MDDINEQLVADIDKSNSKNNMDVKVSPNPSESCNEDFNYQLLDRLKESEDFDEFQLLQYLNKIDERDLQLLLSSIQQANASVEKENDVYEHALSKDESVQNALKMLDLDVTAQSSEDMFSLLSFPAKCYFAEKRLKHLDKEFYHKRSAKQRELQEFQFQLKSMNTSLTSLQKAKNTFDENIRFGGRHPVTKKVILQKVTKYFDDSIKNKMTLTNRYKIQIQHDVMEHNKLSSQIKEQEKRLASLDLVQYQEAQFEHEKSCKSLLVHKEQLAKCKSKFSSIVQRSLEVKKSLEEEKYEVKKIQAAVNKKEHMKNVMLSEKARNDKKVEELNSAMRKIKLDPRRHGLPEVTNYALVKKENESLKRNIKKWQKKVELAEQAKHMHLSSLKKKTHHK